MSLDYIPTMFAVTLPEVERFFESYFMIAYRYLLFSITYINDLKSVFPGVPTIHVLLCVYKFRSKVQF